MYVCEIIIFKFVSMHIICTSYSELMVSCLNVKIHCGILLVVWIDTKHDISLFMPPQHALQYTLPKTRQNIL